MVNWINNYLAYVKRGFMFAQAIFYQDSLGIKKKNHANKLLFQIVK